MWAETAIWRRKKQKRKKIRQLNWSNGLPDMSRQLSHPPRLLEEVAPIKQPLNITAQYTYRIISTGLHDLNWMHIHILKIFIVYDILAHAATVAMALIMIRVLICPSSMSYYECMCVRVCVCVVPPYCSTCNLPACWWRVQDTLGYQCNIQLFFLQQWKSVAKKTQNTGVVNKLTQGKT